MEQLKYIIEDSTIAELLGVQNFTNKESAVLELVKNAFDAKSTQLNIIFQNKSIIIEDNGNGMNLEDIKRNWMHVGKSEKGYSVIDDNNETRILSGSKGIGRFALSRLGGAVKLYSQKENSFDKSVVWITNWNKSSIEEQGSLNEKGTKIIITELRDKWNTSSIEKLSKYLSRTYNDTLMNITIIFEDYDPIIIQKYFMEAKLGYNCTSKISFNFSSDEMKLNCIVESDEFSDESKYYCEDIDINYYESIIDIRSQLLSDKKEKKIDLPEEELDKLLLNLGDFSAELYFSIKESNTNDMDKFLYKYKLLPERYESGIILYRNSFSISSYEGSKDWVGLGKRARLSPAAASHPTGTWRIRDNQIAGKVIIDKQINRFLEDLSNRQGLNENIYYDVFVRIIDIGIATFERYRQSIIRKINVKNKEILEQQKTVTEKLIKDPTIIKDLSKDEVTKFIAEVKELKKESSDFKKEIQTTEERYKYDVRILNVLATSGLKATSIAHEMHNDRNSVDSNCDSIISAMKEFGIWDFVNETERTKYAYSNIPELINKNKRVNTKIVSFMDTMLSEVEKEQFVSENHNIKTLLSEIKNVWERDYAWLKIQIILADSLYFILPADVIKVILDNLILNSIQQNEDRNHLVINIKVELHNGLLQFIYKDDGKGLNRKYADNPMKILEVHETSRKRGHGLGMWIVNNTVVMSGGNIKKINGSNGFEIWFEIGGEI